MSSSIVAIAGRKRPKIRELEVEAVTFVVLRVAGLDEVHHSADYIHLYVGDQEMLIAWLDHIQWIRPSPSFQDGNRFFICRFSISCTVLISVECGKLLPSVCILRVNPVRSWKQGRLG